jgi:hypothetical protein
VFAGLAALGLEEEGKEKENRGAVAQKTIFVLKTT